MVKKEEKNDTYKYVIYGIIGFIVLGLIFSGMFWHSHFLPFLRKHGFRKQVNGRSSLVPRPRLGSFSRTPKFLEATDNLTSL